MTRTLAKPPELISRERIQTRVAELAAAIARDHADAPNGILLIGVLKGAFIFLADLARALTVPNAVDFLALSSYGTNGSTRGAVRIVLDLRANIRGRHVLVVEDIVDTGHTLAYIQRMLTVRQPASLRTCALVTKPDKREVDVQIDYLGFEIPDVWVVGYGLDHSDRYRTLPYIGSVPAES
jgi:hypoxanthine phosphoribosyltransferase